MAMGMGDLERLCPRLGHRDRLQYVPRSEQLAGWLARQCAALDGYCLYPCADHWAVERIDLRTGRHSRCRASQLVLVAGEVRFPDVSGLWASRRAARWAGVRADWQAERWTAGLAGVWAGVRT